jgi:hypothetical protein
MLAKFISPQEIQALPEPYNDVYAGGFTFNLDELFKQNEEIANANGLYQVIEADKPDGDYTAEYAQDGNKIIQSWVVAQID